MGALTMLVAAIGYSILLFSAGVLPWPVRVGLHAVSVPMITIAATILLIVTVLAVMTAPERD